VYLRCRDNRNGWYKWCASCDFGKYKTAPGSATCTVCVAGKFSQVVGSDANVCTCNAGTIGPDGAEQCTSCAVGTYKISSGSASCTLCSTGKFSAITGSSSNVCTYNPGTTGPNGAGACESCAFGTYKIAPGSAMCTVCGTGKSSAAAGSISNVSKYKKKAGTKGSDGEGTCALCAVGKYKTQPGSTPCTECATGKHSIITGSTSNVSHCLI